RVGEDTVRLTDGALRLTPSGATRQEDHRSPTEQPVLLHEAADDGASAFADAHRGWSPLYRVAAFPRRRDAGASVLGDGWAVPRGRRGGAGGGPGAKAPSRSSAGSARTPTL